MDLLLQVDPAFELQDFKAGLTSMVTRLDYSALCATYLSEKIRQYQDGWGWMDGWMDGWMADHPTYIR